MQTTPATAAPTTLTLAQSTQAFEDWENDYRANPDSFYTSEETAAMQVATVSESRAVHFMALLRQRAPAIPAIGQHWPEQGGTYIGIAPAEGTLPMRHLVVLDAEPTQRLTWAKAINWALDQGNGARLPTQLEAMLAYTVARDAFKLDWHWTGTQFSRGNAFAQGFESGSSLWGSKGGEHRVRAFRGLDLQTLNPLTGDAAAAPVEKI